MKDFKLDFCIAEITDCKCILVGERRESEMWHLSKRSYKVSVK